MQGLNFIAIDFETATARRASICEAGICVVKDGKVVDFTTTPSYDVTDTKAKWAVRAANEMGGLGEATEATVSTGIDEAMGQDAAIVSTAWYTTEGRLVKMPQRGVNIKVSKYADGSVKTEKVILPNP